MGFSAAGVTPDCAGLRLEGPRRQRVRDERQSSQETRLMHSRTTSPAKAVPPSSTLAAIAIPAGIDALLTAREAAAYRRQGRSTFWRDVKEGRVPQPIYIAPKSPRWRLSDLCPPRATCEASPQAAPAKRRSTHKK